MKHLVPTCPKTMQVRQKAQDLRLHEARTNLSAAAQKVTGAVASKLSALWEGSPMHTDHPLVQTLQEVSPEQLASAAACVAEPVPAHAMQHAAVAERPSVGTDRHSSCVAWLAAASCVWTVQRPLQSAMMRHGWSPVFAGWCNVCQKDCSDNALSMLILRGS